MRMTTRVCPRRTRMFVNLSRLLVLSHSRVEMPTYTDVCWLMLTYAEYADKWCFLSEHACFLVSRVFWHRATHVYWRILTYTTLRVYGLRWLIPLAPVSRTSAPHINCASIRTAPPWLWLMDWSRRKASWAARQGQMIPSLTLSVFLTVLIKLLTTLTQPLPPVCSSVKILPGVSLDLTSKFYSASSLSGAPRTLWSISGGYVHTQMTMHTHTTHCDTHRGPWVSLTQMFFPSQAFITSEETRTPILMIYLVASKTRLRIIKKFLFS
jgi:hypothetical protein